MTIAKWSLLFGNKGMVGESELFAISTFVQQAQS